MNQTFDQSSSPNHSRPSSNVADAAGGISIRVDPPTISTPNARRRLSIAAALSPNSSPIFRRKNTPHPKPSRSSPFLRVFKKLGRKKVKFSEVKDSPPSNTVDETAFLSAVSGLDTSDISDIDGEDLSDDEDEKMLSLIEDLLEDRKLQEARKEIQDLNQELMDEQSANNDLREELEKLKKWSDTRESAWVSEKRKFVSDLSILNEQVTKLTAQSIEDKTEIETKVALVRSKDVELHEKDVELRELRSQFEDQLKSLEAELRRKDEELSAFRAKLRKKMRTSSLTHLPTRREDAATEQEEPEGGPRRTHQESMASSSASLSLTLRRAKLPQVEKRPLTKPNPFSFVIREEEKRAAKKEAEERAAKEEEKRGATKKQMPHK